MAPSIDPSAPIRDKRLVLLLLIVFAGVFPVKALSVTVQDSPVETLELSKPMERELAAGQTHSYKLTLTAGQFACVEVKPRGVNVMLILFGPGGEKITEIDSPFSEHILESVVLIAETAGDYRLQVRSLDKGTSVGRYRASVTHLRAPTPTDQNRVAIGRLTGTAAELWRQSTEESMRAAIRKYQEALPLLKVLDDHTERGRLFLPLVVSMTFWGSIKTRWSITTRNAH
jgi:hypothetical protein